MLTFEQIAQANEKGEFWAIGDNGKKYHATYCPEYGCMFFAISSTVTVIGYEKI